MNSRFITYPDLVESTNHAVLIIDADIQSIEDVAFFCKVSDTNFDIYLYKESIGDLQWLSAIHDRVNVTLISEDSKVTVSTNNEIIKFGKSNEINHPIQYFQQYTNQGEI